jgi:hypothetical protein
VLGLVVRQRDGLVAGIEVWRKETVHRGILWFKVQGSRFTVHGSRFGFRVSGNWEP